jgi:hypothetical protein
MKNAVQLYVFFEAFLIGEISLREAISVAFPELATYILVQCVRRNKSCLDRCFGIDTSHYEESAYLMNLFRFR